MVENQYRLTQVDDTRPSNELVIVKLFKLLNILKMFNPNSIKTLLQLRQASAAQEDEEPSSAQNPLIDPV